MTERRRAREALQARARQQAAVAELSQQALAEADFNALLDAAVETVVRMLDVDCAKILELLHDEDALIVRSGTGWKQGMGEQLRLPAGGGSQAAYTLRVDEPVIVLDLPSDPRFVDHELLADHDILSGLSVIIRTPERPYGVLSAHSRRHRAFTADDVHFLEAVANVLGVSLQRIRAESALRESESNYRLLMERASDGIIIADAAGRIVSANSRACEMLDCTGDQLRAHGLSEVLPPDGPASPSLRLTQLAAGQTSLSEQQLRRHDGTTLPVEISAKRLEDGRLQAIVRDITERKRAGEEIMRALSLLSATLEATTDGILTVDNQSRITSFNRRFVDMWEVPDDLVAAHDAAVVIRYAATRLKAPEVLLAQSESLGAHPEAEASGLLELRDGRTFEVSSRPQRLGSTWV
ncbi:MAG: PAS domain S-box protein, partial [Acidobacteriota bacterium]|nr:PAS domain S-box protein [Acidobacteriota bacterium]